MFSIGDSWKRIEAVLERNAPKTAATLGPPATDREIDALEEAVGVVLPSDFRESLKFHNGQNDPGRTHDFSGEGVFLDTVQIVEHWRGTTDLDEAFRRDYGNAEWDSGDPWWNIQWIPVTIADGGMLCINMDPSNGNVGQMVAFVHDSRYEAGIAPDFRNWLSQLASRLEKGDFTIEDGHLFLNCHAEE